MIELSNEFIYTRINPFGAELSSLFDRKNNRELLWQAGELWPRHAPNLFPIVGELKDQQYSYKGKSYTMGRHGFARNLGYSVLDQDETSVVLSIKDNEETRKSYPFQFEFLVIYRLNEKVLEQEYLVENTSDSETLWFSFGAHPAFNTSDNFDFSLEWEYPEHALSASLQNGLRSGESEQVFEGNTLALKKGLFDNDALVFSNHRSRSVSLKDGNGEIRCTLRFPHFPYLGIWAKPDAPYVCIEPWMGVADSINATGELTSKEGICALEPGENLGRTLYFELP
ncbi:MAG: aldose 1-epimerase family protein [Bacteroidetes bacterium]|nr:aldose 1-epimerase family protein [Bacteroidota bacterium]